MGLATRAEVVKGRTGHMCLGYLYGPPVCTASPSSECLRLDDRRKQARRGEIANFRWCIDGLIVDRNTFSLRPVVAITLAPGNAVTGCI